jgi:hypothetical protein
MPGQLRGVGRLAVALPSIRSLSPLTSARETPTAAWAVPAMPTDRTAVREATPSQPDSDDRSCLPPRACSYLFWADPSGHQLDAAAALDEIDRAAGAKFDPQVVAALRQALLQPTATRQHAAEHDTT